MPSSQWLVAWEMLACSALNDDARTPETSLEGKEHPLCLLARTLLSAEGNRGSSRPRRNDGQGVWRGTEQRGRRSSARILCLCFSGARGALRKTTLPRKGAMLNTVWRMRPFQDTSRDSE